MDTSGNEILNENGWIDEKFSRILGVARIFQYRDKNFANYSFNGESLFSDRFHRVSSLFEIQNAWKLKNLPLFGQLGAYSGSGYSMHLGRTHNNTKNILNFIKNTKWIDVVNTKLIVIELCTYSESTKIFNVLKVIFEKNGAGNFLASYEIHASNFITNGRSFLLLVIYIAIVFFIVKRRFQFQSIWSIVDRILLTNGTLLAMLIYLRNFYVNQLISELKVYKSNQFVGFQHAQFFDQCVTILLGFLIAITTIRFWKVLQIFKIFKIFNQTLFQALNALMSMAICIFIILAGATGALQLTSKSFSLLNTFTSCIALIMGFDFKTTEHEISTYNNYLVDFCKMFTVVAINILILNLLISIICDYYENARTGVHENFSLVHVVKSKLKNLFKKSLFPAKREVKFFHQHYDTARANQVKVVITSYLDLFDKYLHDDEEEN
jgi:hypothetical protein